MTRLIGGAVLCVLAAGCGFVRVGRPSEPPPSLEEVRAYFAGLPAGYPVSAIERELRLPAPYEHEAPASCSVRPAYGYSYFAHGLWIHFEADDARAATGDEETTVARPFYYMGYWAAHSRQANDGILRRVHSEGARGGPADVRVVNGHLEFTELDPADVWPRLYLVCAYDGTRSVGPNYRLVITTDRRYALCEKPYGMRYAADAYEVSEAVAERILQLLDERGFRDWPFWEPDSDVESPEEASLCVATRECVHSVQARYASADPGEQQRADRLLGLMTDLHHIAATQGERFSSY